MATRSGKDTNLTKRFFRTELFANLVGAPLAAAYGGFMIDFSRVSIRDFLLSVLAIMVANQLVLALPLNLFVGGKAKSGLAAWRSGTLDEKGTADLRSFVVALPWLQAALILARMFVSTGAALLLISSQFDEPFHIAATFTFALYSSFATGLFIYYYLRSASSEVAEELVAAMGDQAVADAATHAKRVSALVDGFSFLVPTLISSLGIFFLMMVIRKGPDNVGFFSLRVVAALVMNVLTLFPILIYSRYFSMKRLQAIRGVLEDMAERGDTTGSVPTDLGDDYALTAHQINRAFGLFRVVLAQLQSASGRLAGTVMSFGSQIKETVAATSQQAAAVKEIVSTMEGSNHINKQIESRAMALSGNASESHSFVDEGFGKVQDTIRKMDEIKLANVETLSEIDGLTEEISSIGEIIDIINGIANQTRIIAFNAELEASSAGAAGASFRIVAEEIRRLANSTVESLAGVKGRISQIQQGSDRLLSSSEEGTVKIAEGIRLSSDLNDIFTRIRDSAESTSSSAGGISQILLEQNQAFEQIFTTLKQISEGAEQVLASTRISGGEVGNLQALIEELKSVLARFEYEEDR